jgi:biopolymer transport protein ExbB/TolQ
VTESDLRQQIGVNARAVIDARRSGVPRLGLRAAIAVALIVGFYATASVWAWAPRVYQLLFERGLWQHAIILVALIALADLIAIAYESSRPDGFGPGGRAELGRGPFAPADLAALAARVRQAADRDRFQVHRARHKRIALALDATARGETRDAIRALTRSQAELDEASLLSRYTLVKLYLWAIPLLGFVGTVEGIGSGIGQFTLSIEQQTQLEAAAPPPGAAGAAGQTQEDALRASLQQVTEGLGRAFDTTYLALVLAVALMVVMSALEKRESDRQLAFDEYCDVHFVAGLPANASPGGTDAQLLAAVQAFNESVAAAADVERAFGRLVDTLRKGIGFRVSLDRPPE